MVDDAAAVAAGGWSFAVPAQVVERAPVDAQKPGRLVDGEEERFVVVIVEHQGDLRDVDVVTLCEPESLGEYQQRGCAD